MSFLRYDPSELRTAGEDFLAALGEISPSLGHASDPAVWSELVLDWLAARASDRARVDAEPARAHLTAALYREHGWAPTRDATRRGLVDLTHVSHPRFSEAGSPFGYAYWESALSSERLEVFFAAQIAWGEGGRPAGRYGRVMLAASDLAALEARSKSIWIATDTEEERRRLLSGLGKLRLASWDTRPWLWVDVAWRSDWQEHGPAFGILEG